MNLMIFSVVYGALKVNPLCKQRGQLSISGTTKKSSLYTVETTEKTGGLATEAASYCSVRC